MCDWNGVTLRCALTDDGALPRSYLAESPDIILNGAMPLPDPSILCSPQSYASASYQSALIGMPNFLYVRGNNATPAGLEGNWALFAAPLNLLLYPAMWLGCPLTTSDGEATSPLVIQPGAIGVSGDPFVWTPEPSTGPAPYSLIAIASTATQPGFPMDITGISGLAAALADQGNFAARSIIAFDAALPSFAFSTAFSIGTEDATIELTLTLENFPLGTSYSLRSDTPFPYGPGAAMQGQTTMQPYFAAGWSRLEIPAEWASNFTIQVTPGNDWSGIPQGAVPRITLRCGLMVQQFDELYELDTDRRMEALAETRDIGPTKAQIVGSVTAILVNAPA